MICIQWGRNLFNEEEEVLTCVPYIPITDQHILMLVDDRKRFPNVDIGNSYMKSTIHCKREALQEHAIDRISMVDKENRTDLALVNIHSYE